MIIDKYEALYRLQDAILEIEKKHHSEHEFSSECIFPFTGSNYFSNESSPRTLVVIDALDDKMLAEFSDSKDNYKSLCAYAMENNSSTATEKIRKKIVCELHSDEIEDIKTIYSELDNDIAGIAFYSFVFPERDGSYPSEVKGPLLDIYIDTFAKVVESLAPLRILFYGNQTLRLINRKKRPDGFRCKTIEDFLQEQGISFKTISLKQNVSVKRNENSQSVTDEKIGQRTVVFAKKVKDDLSFAYNRLSEQYDNLDDKFGTDWDLDTFVPQDDEDYYHWFYYHLVKDKIDNLVKLAQNEINFFETKLPKDFELVNKTENVKQLLKLLKESKKAVSRNHVYAFMEYMDWYKNDKSSSDKTPIKSLSLDEILEKAKCYVEQKPTLDNGKKSNARGIDNVLRAVYKKLVAGTPDDVIYAKSMKNHFLKIQVPFAVDKADIKSDQYWGPEKKPERK